MKTLVIGASGGFGGAVARELLQRGHSVRCLVRPGGREVRLAGAETFAGDALRAEDVERAAADREVIVFGFHLPYPKWDPGCFVALDATLAAAQKAGATVAFPGNVYGLGPDFSRPMTEDAPREALSRKGAIRNEMEAMLQRRPGVRSLVLRAGDYFGPGAANTALELIARRSVRGGGSLFDLGEPGVLHEWAYLPDVAAALVRLLEQRDQLAEHEVFHFEGYHVTSEELMAAIMGIIGPRRVRRFPYWVLSMLSPFWRLAREILEVRYLWQRPVLLDGSRLRARLGVAPMPLADALRRSLEMMLRTPDGLPVRPA